MGFLKRISGWLLKQNSVPYNRLIKGHTVVEPDDFADKDYVDEAYELSDSNLTDSIGAIMARMGFVIIPTNISLSPFPNPITVNGRDYTLVDRQRVLLIGQTTASENGIYRVDGTTLVKINEVSDLEALDGIQITSVKEIGLKRWNNDANMLRFNTSGEAQVRVKNSGDVGGEDVFTGLQVEPSTGELYVLFSSLPGASGSLTVEDYTGDAVGVASKLRLNNDFIVDWDAPNTRAIVSLNPATARFPQAGGFSETFENSNIATNTNETSSAFATVRGYVNIGGTATFTHGQEYAEGVLGYGQISVNPNTGTAIEGGYASRFEPRVNSHFNIFFKARAKIVALANSHIQCIIGLSKRNGFGGMPEHGVFFHLKKGTNSDRIRCICTKSSTSTIVNLGSGYENEGFGYRDFEIHITSSECRFYIDGDLVATIDTNLPDTATDMELKVAMGKTTTSTSTSNDIVRCGLLSYYYERA